MVKSAMPAYPHSIDSTQTQKMEQTQIEPTYVRIKGNPVSQNNVIDLRAKWWENVSNKITENISDVYLLSS